MTIAACKNLPWNNHKLKTNWTFKIFLKIVQSNAMVFHVVRLQKVAKKVAINFLVSLLPFSLLFLIGTFGISILLKLSADIEVPLCR